MKGPELFIGLGSGEEKCLIGIIICASIALAPGNLDGQPKISDVLTIVTCPSPLLGNSGRAFSTDPTGLFDLHGPVYLLSYLRLDPLGIVSDVVC